MVNIDNIKNITIIGTGLMGGYIAQLALLAGLEKVTLNDIKKESIEKCLDRIENGAYDEKEGLRAIESARKMADGLTADLLLERLVIEMDLTKAVEDADFIFEVVPEILEIKQELFKKLGDLAPKHAIFASNSSTIDISKIAEYSGRPEQVLGIHLFIPLFGNRLVEVIKGKNTSDEVMNTCIALGEKFPCPYFKGKMYLARVEKAKPGFIMNRILSVLGIYLNWVNAKAIKKGISWEEIDSGVSISGGNMGWLGMLDYSGLDVIHDSLTYLHDALTLDIEVPEFIIESVKSGNLGAKTGKGYFSWPKGRLQKIDKTEQTGASTLEKLGFGDVGEMIEDLMAIMANEGCRLLDEGVVSGYRVLNKVMAAMNLPSAFSMARRNYEKWIIRLERLAEKTGKNYLKPCNLLKSGDFLQMK